MPHITRVLAVPATGAGDYEDLAALRAQPRPPAERYAAPAATAGLRYVREPAPALSVGLALDDGSVVWGDCVTSAEAGQYGREPAFRATDGARLVEDVVTPALEGHPLTTFRDMAALLDELRERVQIIRPVARESDEPRRLSRRDLLTGPARLWRESRQPKPATERVTVERPLPHAVRYGVSQALLRAVARAQGLPMAQVIAREWALPPAEAPLPLHVQVADERYHVVERMMRRRVASLPDGRVDDAPSQVGDDGVRLSRYVRWVKEQLEARAPDGYHPTLHFDVQGALGDVFRGNLGRVLGQLYGMEFAAKPYPVRVEDPVIEADRATQIEQLRTLRGYVHSRRMQARIVADHWVNTLEDVQAFVEAEAADALHLRPADLGGVHHAVEAVLACHAGNVAVLLGGSATTTDLAAQVRTHVALATRADLLLAGPGRDVDGAVAGTRNEMARALALMARRPVEGA